MSLFDSHAFLVGRLFQGVKLDAKRIPQSHLHQSGSIAAIRLQQRDTIRVDFTLADSANVTDWAPQQVFMPFVHTTTSQAVTFPCKMTPRGSYTFRLLRLSAYSCVCGILFLLACCRNCMYSVTVERTFPIRHYVLESVSDRIPDDEGAPNLINN